MAERTVRARVLTGRKYHVLTTLIAEISQFTKNTREFTAEDFSHAFTIILRVKVTILVLVERSERVK